MAATATPVGEIFPCFGRGPKRPSGSNPLARPSQVPLWAKPTATVPIFIFLSNYSNSILIKVQTSKNCRKLYGLDKIIISILLFEFKLNL
jgi:hypothetical protein